MKKYFIIAGIAAFIMIGTVVAVVLTAPDAHQRSSQDEQPSAAPSLSPSGRPSANPQPGIGDNHDQGVPEFEQKYLAALEKLPHATRYWRLQVDGEVSDGKLPLVAMVYYEGGSSSEGLIDKQKPYVEQFLNSIGMLPENYTLRFQTMAIDSFQSQ